MAEYIIKGDPGAEGHDGRALAATERKVAEYIDREALVERLKFKRNNDDWNNSKYRGLECAIAQVKKAPAADVVEVVRCKDCKHLNAEYRCINWRGLYDYTKADDFCSYGEKR